MVAALARPLAALAAGVAIAWAVGSCGSGGSGTVAEQLKTATSAATTESTSPTATADRTTPTATADRTTPTVPPRTTETVTHPAKTVTQTETNTVTQPAKTVTQATTVLQSSQTNTVAAVPVTTTAGGSEDGSGLPWWGWVLIVGGIVGLGVGLFTLGRRKGPPADGTAGPADLGAPPA